MTNSWTRDVHPMVKPKGKFRKKLKLNESLGEEEINNKIKIALTSMSYSTKKLLGLTCFRLRHWETLNRFMIST